MDAVNDPQRVRAADALLEVREEGRRVGGGREAYAALVKIRKRISASIRMAGRVRTLRAH